MNLVQWLLVGGPGHGQVLWIKAGTNVIYPRSGEVFLYEGENYLCEGRLYRIGCHNPTSIQRAEISILIHATKLEPIT